MKTLADLPSKLKPYAAHGVALHYDDVDKNDRSGNVYGDCPWCGAEGKFNVTLDEGLWRCVRCNIGSKKGGGNVYTFLKTLHELSIAATPDTEYSALAKQRKLLSPNTLKAWGVCQSILTNTWLVPAYSAERKLIQLYRYEKDQKGSMILKAVGKESDGLGHGLMGPEVPTPKGGVQVLKNPKCGPVYRFEGPWDGMAFWEVARQCRRGDEGRLVPTSNEEASLLGPLHPDGGGTVIAVPGCGMFSPSWVPFFAGRPDISFYDNDHPKEWPVKSGKMVQPALDGTKRALGVLASTTPGPSECWYVRWGITTFHDPGLPHGYDVRDHLSRAGDTVAERMDALDELLSLVEPIPQEWAPGTEGGGKMGTTITPCKSWRELIKVLRKACVLTPGIQRSLAVMLSSVLSVTSCGDQLWVMLIGPPSSFKTTLAEALSTNRRYIVPKDTLTGMFSGFQVNRGQGENLSLVKEMADKTLVIKDGDTVLRSPQRDKIMSELRALYDRCLRTQFKNTMSQDWEALNSTVILCGTASLFEMDSNDRGARFITIDIQPKNDYTLEDDITLRVAHRASRDVRIHANGTMESHDSPEIVAFKQLCGGYISYLRENSTTLIEAIEDTDEAIQECVQLATFVSYMRCRPPKRQDEKVEREMPFRLVSQFVRLAKCLAVVLNKRTMDEEVMDIVRHAAFDTGRGKVFDLCEFIRADGHLGADPSVLAMRIGESRDETVKMLRFLRKIAAVEMREPHKVKYIKQRKPRWFLTPRLSKLFDQIFGASGATTTGRLTNPSAVPHQESTGDED